MNLRKLLTTATLFVVGALGFKANAQSEWISGGTYYFYNEESGKFMSRGAAWGTRATADDYGIAYLVPWSASSSSNYLKNVDHSLVLNKDVYLGSNMFTDNENAHTFYVHKFSSNRFSIPMNSGYIGLSSPLENGEIELNVIEGDVNAEGVARWSLYTKDQYEAKIKEIEDAKAKEVADNAGINALETKVSSVEELEEELKSRLAVDKTSLIQNANIGGGSSGWTKVNTGVDRGLGDTRAGDGVFQCWNGTLNLSQTVTGLAEGVYKVSVQAFYRHGNAQTAMRVGENYSMTANLFANTSRTRLESWYDIRTSNTYPNTMKEAHELLDSNPNIALVEIYTYVGEDGTLKLGIDNSGYVNEHWLVCDNFKLTYYSDEITEEAISAIITEANNLTSFMMEQKTLEALNNSLNSFKSENSMQNYNALSAAIANAKTSIEKYASAKEALDAMLRLMESTNVYTEVAFETYKTVYDNAKAKYDARTLTFEEISALENPEIATGWRANNIVDNFLLSAWDTNADFADPAPYYINTWSVEGENDGSNFKVPFFEYFVDDNKTLAERILKATVSGLESNKIYKVSAWVRVRVTNNSSGAPTGITFSVGEGEPTDVTAGQQIGTLQYYIGEFQALGSSDADGNLTIKFNVSADNNISWLAFKNVKYESTQVAPTSITLDKTEIVLNAETKTTTLTPTLLPVGSDDMLGWSSSDETIATVENGVVTGLIPGEATITVYSILDPNVKATAKVIASYPEAAFETGETQINDGPKRTIVTIGEGGNNLIINGGFEYGNGFYCWKNGAGGDLKTNEFEIVTEEGNSYLKSKGHTGTTGAASIGTLWPIEDGKTYVFGYKIKSSGEGSSTFINASLTDEENPSGDGSVISTNIKYRTSWTEVKCEFTNNDGFKYLQFRARWLGENGAYTCFDDFYLTEVTTKVEGNVDYIKENVPTVNIGNGVFQYSQANIDAVHPTTLVQGEASVEDVQAAYDKMMTLNAPAADTRYAAVLKWDGWTYDNKAMTYIAGGRSDAGGYNIQYLKEQNSNYAQAFIFTPVEGELNTYLMSQIDNDGVERYISTGKPHGGNPNQIRTVTESDKALKVKVIATTKEGICNLYNTEANNYIGSQDAGVYTVNSHIDFAIVEASEAEVTLNSDGGYYTLMLPFAEELPTGMKAYTCAEVDGNVLTLTEATSFAPNTPYIVVEGAGDYTFSGYGLAKADSYTEGLLTGAYAETDVPAGRYVLAVKPGESDAKFYVVGDAGAKLPAYRAYLTVANSEVKAFTIGRGDATGISAIEALQNGDAEIYTINGTRVNTLQKGVNIIKMSNGKTQKVLVK